MEVTLNFYNDYDEETFQNSSLPNEARPHVKDVVARLKSAFGVYTPGICTLGKYCHFEGTIIRVVLHRTANVTYDKKTGLVVSIN